MPEKYSDRNEMYKSDSNIISKINTLERGLSKKFSSTELINKSLNTLYKHGSRSRINSYHSQIEDIKHELEPLNPQDKNIRTYKSRFWISFVFSFLAFFQVNKSFIKL